MSDIPVINLSTPSAPATEAKGVETAADTIPTESTRDQFTARFAALSKQEKALFVQKEAMKAQTDKYSSYEALEKEAKSNPMKLLERYGLSLDDLIISALGNADAPAPEMDPMEAIRAEIAAMKAEKLAEIEGKEKAEVDAYQSSIDEAILNHQNAIATHIKDNIDAYELINVESAHDLVWEVTEAQFELDGVILSPKDAADRVEAYLEQRYRKALDLNKFKVKKDEPVKMTQPLFEETVKQPVKSQATQTLTVDHSGLAQKPATRLSNEESKKRAAAMLQWK